MSGDIFPRVMIFFLFPLSPDSTPVRAIAFSHPRQDMMGVVVLETEMSVLYTHTPCVHKTFCFNSWTSCTLYDQHALFPVMISTSRTACVFKRKKKCVEGIQKKLGSSCVMYRFFCHFTTQNCQTEQIHFWLFIFFYSRLELKVRPKVVLKDPVFHYLFK